MVLADAVAVAPRLDWRAVVALGKPRLSAMVLCTTGVGLWLAPAGLGWPRASVVLLATALVVAAANGVNSYLERHTDALMRRTRQRPIPAGRVEPQAALTMALVAALLSIATLYWAANPLTALLAFVAFAIYGWVYTPMKRYSWAAVLVGAIPGAIPPLMGWTAVTGRLGEPGLALFALMFFWQLPHFLAIAVYLKDDYARGGLQVLPVVRGIPSTVRWMLVSTLVLVPVSLWPWAAGMGGLPYGVGALFLGALFAGFTATGLGNPSAGRWARRVFIGSIGYLILLLTFLVTGAHST